MRRVAIWLSAMAAACFSAGVGAGLVLPRVLAAGARESALDSDEEYVRRFTGEYGLSQAQAQLLRTILAARRLEEDRVLRSNLESYPPEVQARYRDAGRRVDQRIEGILDENQRRRFLADRNR